MKKFKKLYLVLLLTFLVSVSSLIADDYPIGNSDHQVVAEEFYAFLCDSKAVQSEPSLEKLKEDFLSPESSLLISCEGTFGHYYFSNPSYQWNTPIPTVPSEYAQQLFQQWRQNPTIQELCYYLNDRIRQKKKLGPGADWVSLKYSYPQSVTIPQADKVVDLYGSRGTNWSTYSFLNEVGNVVFSFSPVTYLLDLKNICDQRYSNSKSDQHDYYHRPTVIELDGKAIF